MGSGECLPVAERRDEVAPEEPSAVGTGATAGERVFRFYLGDQLCERDFQCCRDTADRRPCRVGSTGLDLREGRIRDVCSVRDRLLREITLKTKSPQRLRERMFGRYHHRAAYEHWSLQAMVLTFQRKRYKLCASLTSLRPATVVAARASWHPMG